jgi:hypothetical protein
MIMLLTILALGVAVGRWSRRVTPIVDLLLFLGVSLAVLAQMLTWEVGVELDLADLLRGPGALGR